MSLFRLMKGEGILTIFEIFILFLILVTSKRLSHSTFYLY